MQQKTNIWVGGYTGKIVKNGRRPTLSAITHSALQNIHVCSQWKAAQCLASGAFVHKNSLHPTCLSHHSYTENTRENLQIGGVGNLFADGKYDLREKRLKMNFFGVFS